MTTRFGFADLVRCVHARIVTALGLVPVRIDAALARAEGSLRGQPLVVDAVAHRGGPVAHVRCATVVGEAFEVGSLMAIGRAELGLPILGLDLVAIGGERALVVADLSPTDPQRPACPVFDEAVRAAALPSAGSLPAWAVPWFSDRAVFARVELDRREGVHALVDAIATAFVERARTGTIDRDRAPSVRATTCGWVLAHRAEDKSVAVLTHALGEAWARRFAAEVMFPEVSP